ncbi:hypothetical protein KS4_26510 [Poriferisphaera corsica]|uniref:Uncharacterized protein n=1 Tax=Poriferisphaera corsica TaxID=2528020 RepID=A0A517YWH1_9BACT|nr:hypothetical protein KS4_26510 [Poriferisphaera corsica]
MYKDKVMVMNLWNLFTSCMRMQNVLGKLKHIGSHLNELHTHIDVLVSCFIVIYILLFCAYMTYESKIKSVILQ